MNQYKEYREYKDRKKIRRHRAAVSLALVLFAGTVSGCSLPESFMGIVQPVEEAVSTVKKKYRVKAAAECTEAAKGSKEYFQRQICI